MSDIDPTELRRLRALESRMAKATETTKELRAERRELKRTLTSVEKRADRAESARKDALDAQQSLAARTAEQESQIVNIERRAEEAEALVDTLKRQIDELIEENRRAAEEKAALAQDAQTFRTTAEGLRTSIEIATKEARSHRDEQEQLSRRVEALTAERDIIVERLALMEAQLQDEGKVPAIPAGQVVQMIGGLMDAFQTGVPGMALQESTISLRVALESAGDHGGFVIPRPGSSEEMKDILHELTFSFDGRQGHIG